MLFFPISKQEMSYLDLPVLLALPSLLLLSFLHLLKSSVRNKARIDLGIWVLILNTPA